MSISSDVSIATGVKISMVIHTALEAAKMYLFLKPHHSSLQILHKINTNVHTGCTCSSIFVASARFPLSKKPESCLP